MRWGPGLWVGCRELWGGWSDADRAGSARGALREETRRSKNIVRGRK